MDASNILSIAAFLASGACTILCVFLNGIYKEMKKLNDQLLTVVTNQGWHYNAIQDLQHRVGTLEKKQINL